MNKSLTLEFQNRLAKVKPFLPGNYAKKLIQEADIDSFIKKHEITRKDVYNIHNSVNVESVVKWEILKAMEEKWLPIVEIA